MVVRFARIPASAIGESDQCARGSGRLCATGRSSRAWPRCAGSGELTSGSPTNARAPGGSRAQSCIRRGAATYYRERTEHQAVLHRDVCRRIAHTGEYHGRAVNGWAVRCRPWACDRCSHAGFGIDAERVVRQRASVRDHESVTAAETVFSR
jgi:hypothetical protein